MQEEKKDKAKQLNLFSGFDVIPLLDEFDREYALKLQKNSETMRVMIGDMGYGISSEHRMLRSPAVHITSDMLAPQSFEARPYIIDIVTQALKGNFIIILPTGLGKTYAGILAILETFKINPFGKVLMVAPTKPLCKQHKKTFSNTLPLLTTGILTGAISPKKRLEVWQKSHIIIATADTIKEELKKKSGVGNAMDISLFLIDEVHHLSGNYPYSRLARHYQEFNKNILIGGLTASLNPDISRLEKLQEILDVPDSQIIARSYNSPDVKPYVFVRFIKPVFLEKNLTDQQRSYKTTMIEMLTRTFRRLSELSGESLINYAYRNDSGKVVGIRIKAFNGLMKRLQKLLMHNGDFNQELGFAMVDWATAMKLGNAIDRLQKGMPEFIFFMQKQFANHHKKKTPSSTQFANHQSIRKIMAEIITSPIRKKLHIELTKAVENLENLLDDDMQDITYRNDLGQSTTVYKEPFKQLGDNLKVDLEQKTINHEEVEITVEKLIAWTFIKRIQTSLDCINTSISDLVHYLQYEQYYHQTETPPPSCQLFMENENIRQIMAWLVHYNLWQKNDYPSDITKSINIGGEINWEEAWYEPKLRAIAEEVNGLEKRQMLIFVNYRDTQRKVMKFLKQKYPNIVSSRLTGTSHNYGDPGMKQKEQEDVLEKYMNKKIQILVSTSIGEEGLDFPAVDTLIFFEPISDVLRYIQRLGRTGRHKHGNVRILIYKDTSEESIYYTSKAEAKAVEKIIQYFQYKAEQKRPSC